MALTARKGIPIFIEVGPYDYTVTIDPDECAKAGVGKDHPNWGKHEGDKQRILVCPGVTTRHEAVILMHELLHAVLWTHEIRPSEDHDEEQLVRTLAPALVDLFKRNPALAEYLADS